MHFSSSFGEKLDQSDLSRNGRAGNNAAPRCRAGQSTGRAVPPASAHLPEAAHGPSTMGVRVPRAAPARMRTRSCPRAARPLPVAGLPLCPSLLQCDVDVTYKEAGASPRVRRSYLVHPPVRHGPPWPPPLDTFRCPPPKPRHHPGTSSSPYRSSLLALSRRHSSTSLEVSP
jgi:hypothetical protein